MYKLIYRFVDYNIMDFCNWFISGLTSIIFVCDKYNNIPNTDTSIYRYNSILI